MNERVCVPRVERGLSDVQAMDRLRTSGFRPDGEALQQRE